MMYVVIKHTNEHEQDTVNVVCVTNDKQKAYLQLLMEVEDLYEQYEVLDDSKDYKRFTNQHQEALIEVFITESIYVDW